MRTEKDTLGKIRLPDNVYYGAQTKRAVVNFPVSGLRLPRKFIKAQGAVKLAAARTNRAFGRLDKKVSMAIEKAAREVMRGDHDGHFVVDVYQAGAGTSQNMNANEVIANRAIEILGGRRGDYGQVHPNDHVNMAQSTNDTIPASIYISSYEAVQEGLMPALGGLKRALSLKARKFDRIIKSGRTHLQDAVPVRLGQEFGAFAEAVGNDIGRIKTALKSLLDLPLGGTALGSGINTYPGFRKSVIQEIRKITGIKFRSCRNLFEGAQNVARALELSAALRGISITLTKIANDIRLLSSGPRTGFAEIRLPAVQPGSSIMPGKVNPVMAEMLNMVCFQVIGNDTAISYAAQAAQLEINVMTPLVAHNLLFSIEILSNAVNAFAGKCVKGISADAERCREYADATLAIATALNPVIGYISAAEISKEAFRTGKTVRQLVVERGIFTEKEASLILDPEKLTG